MRTIEDAREFLESVGFCLMYPISSQDPGMRGSAEIVLPTFIGAVVGGDENLPTRQQAFADPRAHEATELAVRLLRERSAYEASVFGENNFAGGRLGVPLLLRAGRGPQSAARNRARTARSRRWRRTRWAASSTQARSRSGAWQEMLGGDLSEAGMDRRSPS